MDNHSQNMLRRVEANDVECTDMQLGHSSSVGRFTSSDSSDIQDLVQLSGIIFI